LNFQRKKAGRGSRGGGGGLKPRTLYSRAMNISWNATFNIGHQTC